MLGIAVGLVSAVGILTLFNRDPVAIERHRKEQQQAKEKSEVELKHQREEQQRIANDPQLKQRREQKQKDFKERLLKNLSADQRKLIEDYMNEEKEAGKSEHEIIKTAGMKAMLFFLFVMIVVIVLAIAAVVLAGGNLDKVGEAVGTMGQSAWKFVEWNFPRLAASNAEL